MAESISKICGSVHHSKTTPARKQLFKEACEMARIPKQALPSIDVPTRWNSTYVMLKSVMPYKDAYNDLVVKDAS
jgi:hypothetical protein